MIGLLKNPDFLTYQNLLDDEIYRLKSTLVNTPTWEKVLLLQGRILALEYARDLVKNKELKKLKPDS